MEWEEFKIRQEAGKQLAEIKIKKLLDEGLTVEEILVKGYR